MNVDKSVSTLAGNSQRTQLDGIGDRASFCYPAGLAVDSKDVTYVNDWTCVRRVSDVGEVTTVAGGPSVPRSSSLDGIGQAARFRDALAVVLDEGRGLLYVSETHSIRCVKLSDGAVTTIAGSHDDQKYRDGRALTEARFSAILGAIMSEDGWSLMVTDMGAKALRKVQLVTDHDIRQHMTETFSAWPPGLMSLVIDFVL